MRRLRKSRCRNLSDLLLTFLFRSDLLLTLLHWLIELVLLSCHGMILFELLVDQRMMTTVSLVINGLLLIHLLLDDLIVLHLLILLIA